MSRRTGSNPALLAFALLAPLMGCGDGAEEGDGSGEGILDQLTFDTTVVDFRGVPLKLEVTSSIQITNTGVEAARIDDIVTDPRFATDAYAFRRVSDLPLRIRPGTPTSLQFAFRASEPVTRVDATTRVVLEFASGETLELGLVAETAEALEVNTTRLDFGEVLVGRPAPLILRVRNLLNRPVPVYALTFGGRARPEMLEGIGRFEVDSAVNEDGRLVNAAPLAATNSDGDSIDIEIRYLPDPSAVSQDRARWRVGACPELDDDCSIEIELVGQPIPSPISCRDTESNEPVDRIDFGNLNPPETGSRTLDCVVRAPVRLTSIGTPLSATGVEVTTDLIDPTPLVFDEEDQFTMDVTFDPDILEPGTDIPDDADITLGLRDPENDAPFDTIEIDLRGGHGRPDLRVSPEPVDFQSAAAGTRRPERLVVTNLAPIPFSGRFRIDLGEGTSTGEFSSARENAAIDLDPGESETIQIDFNPSLPAGPRTASAVLETTEDSDPRNPDFRREVALTGRAEDLSGCEIFVSTEAVEFGRSIPLTENRAYVAVTNIDSGTCLLNGIRLAPSTDPEFRLIDPPDEIRLSPDESHLFELGYVTDRPIDAPDLEASGTFEFYASTIPSVFELPISAEQSRLALVRGPNLVDLRAGDTTCGSYRQTVSLLNGDVADLTIRSIELTGPDAFAFELTEVPTTPFDLSSRQGRETFQVVLDPSLADETLVSAQVEVTLADTNQPFIIPVLARAEAGSLFEEQFAQADSADVDVIFVLPHKDGGGALLQASRTFSDFIAPIRAANLGYHIGFVTGELSSQLCGSSIASEPPGIISDGACGLLATGPVGVEHREEWRVLDGTETSPSESLVFEEQMKKDQGGFTSRVLDHAHLALHPEPVRGWNAEIHRPDSLIHLVFIDRRDDTVSPGSVEFYAETLRYARGYPRRFDITTSAIVGPEEGCFSPDVGIADPATRILDVVKRVGGGLPQSVCSSDWAVKMEQVGRDATGIRRRVQLAREANASSIRVEVDGTNLPRFDGPEENWAFDSSLRVLTLRDPSALTAGAQISVSYRPVCTPN